MRSIIYILKKAFFLLYVIFLYLSPFCLLVLPMVLDEPFHLDYKNLNRDEKLTIILMGGSQLFLGLIFYIGYLKIKFYEERRTWNKERTENV
jgi:hypothetical protein